MNARIINAPGSEVVRMLERRMPPETRQRLHESTFNAVGLLRVSIPDLYFFADLVMKASNVFAVELHGSCPQHVTTLAFFGETSAVDTAMRAVLQHQDTLL